MASNIRPGSKFFGKNVFIAILLLITIIFLPVFISFYTVTQSQKSFSTVSLVSHLKVAEGENITKTFAAYGYNLAKIKRGEADVPNLFLEQLPRELTTLKNNKTKKDLFISSLLPPILKVNEYIRYERKRLLKIIKSIEINGDASLDELFWLRRKMLRYRMEEFNIDELHSRMNIIPVSLALTQSAIETGWGTSRFAQDGNALFGQWTWNDASGIVPLGREVGATHSIKRFNDLISAVEGYSLNLNTHSAYQDFRTERAKFSRNKIIVVDKDLLFTLLYYSELGFAYIDSLTSIIGANNLRSFDNVKLQKTAYQKLKLSPIP